MNNEMSDAHGRQQWDVTPLANALNAALLFEADTEVVEAIVECAVGRVGIKDSDGVEYTLIGYQPHTDEFVLSWGDGKLGDVFIHIGALEDDPAFFDL